MGKSSAPPPPDYAAAATAQGAANKETAIFNAGANRVNQITPQGALTWTIRPGADPNNPQPGDYIQTTTLSPEQQGIYDRSTQIESSLLDTSADQLGRVSDTFNTPLDLSTLPAWKTSGQGSANPAMSMQLRTSGQGSGQGLSGAMPSGMGGRAPASIASSAGQGVGGPQPMPAAMPSSAMTGAGAPGQVSPEAINSLVAAMMSRKQ